MSNYFAQIAARNVAIDQPMAAPAYTPVEKPADDPFDRSAFAATEVIQPGEDIRPLATTSFPASKGVPDIAQPANEGKPAATTPVAIKPVYLSKYIERNQADLKDTSYKSTTKPQSAPPVVGAGFEHKASPLLPAAIKPPAKTAMEGQATGEGKTGHVQQPEIDRESRSHQQPILLQPIEPIKEQHSLSPTAAATKPIATPVFLQPHAPMESQESPQKEKPPPSLVIGKITVEIVPAQKPVNKIIHQVIKSQPSTPSAPRSKSSFGLGQL
jgi:hypothetical protein